MNHVAGDTARAYKPGARSVVVLVKSREDKSTEKKGIGRRRRKRAKRAEKRDKLEKPGEKVRVSGANVGSDRGTMRKESPSSKPGNRASESVERTGGERVKVEEERENN